jgi:hypothetical protein
MKINTNKLTLKIYSFKGEMETEPESEKEKEGCPIQILCWSFYYYLEYSN